MNKLCRLLADSAATEQLGAQLAAHCPPASLIYLQGELGAGKTTLVRGFLRQLGHQGAVKSPTYTLVEPYQFGARRVFHFDLYRLADPEELDYLGIRDYFAEGATCLIEWPQQGAGFLPAPDLRLYLHHRERQREAELSAETPTGTACLRALNGD